MVSVEGPLMAGNLCANASCELPLSSVEQTIIERKLSWKEPPLADRSYHWALHELNGREW